MGLAEFELEAQCMTIVLTRNSQGPLFCVNSHFWDQIWYGLSKWLLTNKCFFLYLDRIEFLFMATISPINCKQPEKNLNLF